MLGTSSFASLFASLILIAPAFTPPQDSGEKRTLIINGQTTQVPVIQVSGRSYIDLEGLANAVNGSLSYSGNMIALSVPIRPVNGASSAAQSAAPAPAPTAAAPPAANPGFSQGFLNAGIEEMSTLREWHAALATAIQNGIPVTAGMLAPYRMQATTNLRYAQVAVTTPSDRNAYQLLNNVFQNMGKLSDKYVNMRANMTYISPDALQSDDLDQRLRACGRSLSAMAASGQFVDDGSCH
ncbi:MAG TPA: hypothetical protein VEU52_08235 [Candidatus Limnocylindrales bacterium]|jgi:hypothetical protein|nr:hypothetical protein [Candidatus Limnocylindrales bacterium]